MLIIGMGLGGILGLIERSLRSIVGIVGHVECAGGGWSKVALSGGLVNVGLADAVGEVAEVVRPCGVATGAEVVEACGDVDGIVGCTIVVVHVCDVRFMSCDRGWWAVSVCKAL